MSFSTLILSAGRSRRMGQPKAWLRYQDEPFLQRLVRVSLAAGSHQIIIVVGAETGEALVSRETLLATLPAPLSAATTLAIGCPSQTPIDSIRQGLGALTGGPRLLLWPIDCPFAETALVEQLARSFLPTEDAIARPCVEGRHGHPVLFGSVALEELKSPIADTGAHHVVRRDPRRLLDVPCDDARVVADLNTPAEARALGVTLPALP
jgi:CTP:molybdopterin cytidylyltransferase MocA